MSVKDALAGGGWVLALVLSVSAFFAGEAVKPVENVVEPVVEVAFAPGPCHAGWSDTSTSDEHTRVLSCTKGQWIVFLRPDGSFNYAWDGISPAFETDPTKVPNW